ncbi:MAG: undecaprenyl-phosphate glucose phosphotransferase [Planctomycetota bacterium]
MNPSLQNKIIQEDSVSRLILKFGDAASIIFGLLLLLRIVPEFNSKSTIVVSLVAIGIFNLVAEFVGLYRNWRGASFEREACYNLFTWMLTFVSLGLLGNFSLYSTEISQQSLTYWFLITPVLSLAFRIVIRWVYLWMQVTGINTRSYAVLGINDLGIHLANNINSIPELGLKFTGFFDDRPKERTSALPVDLGKKLGNLDQLLAKVKRGEIQVIYITLPMRAEGRIRSFISQLSDSTASVYIVPDLFVFQMLNSRWTDIRGLPVVSVFENPLFGVEGAIKRSIDLALGSFALVCLSIPMMAVALAVKLTSRGPVFFRQKRYGLDGREILVWKFRSMKVQENGTEVKQATRNDNRLTAIGGFLRRSSIDELPQLFNVIVGQMSLVGPRPHANAHNEFYRRQIEGYMLRHKIKPGITGLAQVSGFRGETETLDKMEKRIWYDHQYIREWSVWLDLKIIAKTISVVFSRENAY